MCRVGAELGGVIVQLVSSPWSNEFIQGQEGMQTSQKPSAPKSVIHIGPNTNMTARQMVSWPVTTNPPAGRIQIGQQIAAHMGSQQFIRSNTGRQRPNTFNARSMYNMSGTGPTGPRWGREHILIRLGR